ncbi:Hypothetical predicted protein [Cloeon dipterum]|uniref:C-type lectin domain-containing protein n=1 Tax=Cloeon dipterum TaxID=197152 RepID=A0A8S1DWJ6_9INSE|nr:Hypothetical predicted protein [Cloeon dipterum]
MVLVNRLFFQVLCVFSTLVTVAEVWGKTTRRQESTIKPLKKRIRKPTTRTTVKPTTSRPKTEGPYEFCRNYNRIKKNVQDTALSEDFITGKRDSMTELLDVRDRPIGTFNQRGIKITFDSVDKVEYSKAVEACLLRKLQLLALEIIDDSYFGGRQHRVFVDECGAVFEKRSAEQIHEFVLESHLVSKQCGNSTRLHVEFEQIYSALLHSFFTCESACSKPVCPFQNDCHKDESLFEVIGEKTYLKKEHEIRGTWELAEFGFYFLGEKLVNWKENWMTCCSLGLKPLAITNSFFNQFNRLNSPMQGLVYWSAMTRAGCLLFFENCLHNASESIDVEIYAVRKGGSCVAVSSRDPKATELMIWSLAVKTNLCASKLLLGCQGTEQTFEIRDDKINNCDLPECTGIPDCVMEDEFFLKQPFKVLLAPWRFGNWHSCCDNSILELRNEYGTWDEAYKRCCSLGMNLLSVHNPAKQDCLGNPYKNSNPNEKGYLPFRTEAWTAGRDIESCRGKLRWCTGYLNDYLKNDLTWKKGQDPRFANNSCVYIDFGDPVVPSLALADCSEKKQIICEAPMGVGFKSQMHYHNCRRNFRVKESDAEKIWTTGDLSRTSYAAKKMIQCLAEHIGLVYNSTKINVHVYLKMMSRLFRPFDYDLMEKTKSDQLALFSSLKAHHDEKKISNFIVDMNNNVKDDYYSDHFDFSSEMIIKLYDCKGINVTNEETFAFDFLVCFLQSKAVERFWRFYEFNLEKSSVIPAENDLNSPCLTFENFLENKSSCIPPHNLLPLTETGPYLTMRPINIKMFNTSSFTACLEKRGSLPYAETKEEFEVIYYFIRRMAPKLPIIWDQGYYDKLNGKFMWCRSDIDPLQPGATIPIPVTVNATMKQDFVMLVSLPGAKPNLHAVPATEQLMYQTSVFCRVPDYVVNECLSHNLTDTLEY